MLGACANWLRLARRRLHDVYAAAGRFTNSNGYKHNPCTTACSTGIGSALLPVQLDEVINGSYLENHRPLARWRIVVFGTCGPLWRVLRLRCGLVAAERSWGL